MNHNYLIKSIEKPITSFIVFKMFFLYLVNIIFERVNNGKNMLEQEIYNSLENKKGVIWEFTLAIRVYYYKLFSELEPNYFNFYSFTTHNIELEDIRLQNLGNSTVDFVINGTIYDSCSGETIFSNKSFLFSAKIGYDIPRNEKFDFISYNVLKLEK